MRRAPDLTDLYREADRLLADRPHLAQAIKTQPAQVHASPLGGLNAARRRRVRALAKAIHVALSAQPPLFELS